MAGQDIPSAEAPAISVPPPIKSRRCKMQRAEAGSSAVCGSPTRKEALPSGLKLVQSAAKRAEQLWIKVKSYLEKEWKAITPNLGVKSGTAVIEELQLMKAHGWIKELHLLVVTHDTAAAALSDAVGKLTRPQMQQLQVLLDMLGHEHLSDYLRLTVFNVRDPFVSKPVDVATSTCFKATRRRKPASGSGTTSTAAECAARRSCAGVLPPYEGRRPHREEHLRFAGFLKEDHPLVQQAYKKYYLKARNEFEGQSGQQHGEQPGDGQANNLQLQLGLSLQEEFAALEASARKPERICLWLDVEKRWQQTIHTVHRHELLNPLMVSAPAPLYAVLPEFKAKQAAEEAAAAEALAALPSPASPSPGRRAAAAGRSQPSTPSSPHGAANNHVEHKHVGGSMLRTGQLLAAKSLVPAPSVMLSTIGDPSGPAEPTTPGWTGAKPVAKAITFESYPV